MAEQQQDNPTAAARLQARELLRQSSATLNTGSPTRTLRITAHEQSNSNNSRDNTPLDYSREELARRPRSNPRSRTPMRYESPLETDAFRRRSPSPNNNNDDNVARRITIRPLAGATVGTVGARTTTTTIQEQQQQQQQRPSRSRKQGPSHRKIRRWNNDKFSGLAAEIKAANSNNAAAVAEVWLKAQSEAHLYRAIYDPNEHGPSKQVKACVLVLH